VTTISNEEATVAGAAIFAFIGADTFSSVEEGQSAAQLGERTTEPSEQSAQYEALYEAYRRLPPALEGYYRGERAEAGTS
jgi:sugar (pentulose or hexulose) kinase